MTQREMHKKDISDIETLYKSVESDLDIELTNREKVIISLLVLDYKGVQTINYNKKESRTKYTIVRISKSDADNAKNQSKKEQLIKGLQDFASKRGIEIFIEESSRHLAHANSIIYAIHMNGRASDLNDMVQFFNLQNSSEFGNREIQYS